MRYAIITDTTRNKLETIDRYIPGNYSVEQTDGGFLIQGQDNAGWTLDGYIIPRLASGLIFAKEVTAAEAIALTGRPIL